LSPRATVPKEGEGQVKISNVGRGGALVPQKWALQRGKKKGSFGKMKARLVRGKKKRIV